MKLIARDSDGLVTAYGEDMEGILVPEGYTMHEYECTYEEFKESLPEYGEMQLQEGTSTHERKPHVAVQKLEPKNPATEMMTANKKTSSTPVTYNDLIELVRKLGMEI